MKFLLVCNVSLLNALQELQPFSAIFVYVLLALVELLQGHALLIVGEGPRCCEVEKGLGATPASAEKARQNWGRNSTPHD